VAPPVPERFTVHIRLGRDGDIDEWLATDTLLDRPVLIRVLNPGANAVRRRLFQQNVQATAAVSHVHLAAVYTLHVDDEDAYAVVEWNGGVSIEDRIRAGETIPVSEFLPNAAGLAEGLAALHAVGVVHGSIEPSAVHFSAAHPAKLGAAGRTSKGEGPEADTAALARTLRAAVTGTTEPGIAASQVAEGLSPEVDAALAAAESGELSAATLASALRAIRYEPRQVTARGWTWTWLVPATVLVVAAAIIAGVGLSIDTNSESPFLFPATPQPRPVVTTTSFPPVSTTTTLPAGLVGFSAIVADPFGDGTEHDDRIPLLADGDVDTSWTTERYFDPLPRIKDGVGVVLTPVARVSSMEIVATTGTSFSIAWSSDAALPVQEWEHISSAVIATGTTTIQLPDRDGGSWLLWLTDLPDDGTGEFVALVREVRFGS
jgi:Protein tyrosine and serine/threonine kinase